MKKNVSIIFVLIVLFLGGLLYGINYVIHAAPIASAYNAKILCSATFVSKRQPEDIIKTDLSQFGYVTKNVNQEEKSVTASVFGLGKTKAIYREGLGCTLVIGGTTEEQLKNQYKNNQLVNTNPPKNENQEIEKNIPKNVDFKKINLAIDQAFNETDSKLPKITRAVVVLYKGKIIAERYASGFSKDTPMLGWSMTKSVINTLMGILVKQNKISIKDNNLFPEWNNDQRKNISIDDLMKMSSGLTFDEEYGSISDATKMLFTVSDTANYALNKPLKFTPGSEWSYSSGTTNILSKIIRRTIGEKDYLSFPYKEIFYKIGMNSALMEPDPSGTFVGSSFMYATARDWAKFGQLYLQNGMWNNKKILPDNWVKYTITPAPKSENKEYGAQFWLNAGSRWKNVPNDVYNTDGFEGQSVVICPSYDTVIVRLGLSKKSESWKLEDFVSGVLDGIKK